MKLKVLAVIVVLLAVFFTTAQMYKKTPTPIASQTEQTSVPPQFEDKTLFLSAIKQSTTTPSKVLVTGITVPHHLLAIDLIAKAFNFASYGKYSEVLLISPDHFNLGQSNISISENNFSTVFGNITTDLEAVKKIETLAFVKNQNFFYREHGLGAELPFIKYYFPDAKIIALTFKESTPRAQLEKIVEQLKANLDENVFIVQSTDFSHYLTPENAQTHDEQTIKVLESGEAEQLFSLNQPDNTDSIAAQYVQMRLQNELMGSKLHILEHRNSQDYTKERVNSSTSYIIQAFLK